MPATQTGRGVKPRPWARSCGALLHPPCILTPSPRAFGHQPSAPTPKTPPACHTTLRAKPSSPSNRQPKYAACRTHIVRRRVVNTRDRVRSHHTICCRHQACVCSCPHATYPTTLFKPLSAHPQRNRVYDCSHQPCMCSAQRRLDTSCNPTH